MKKITYLTCIAFLLSGCLGDISDTLSNFGQPIKITFAEIQKDYKDNTLAGEKKWNGKFVEIDGMFEDVKKNNLDNYFSVSFKDLTKSTKCSGYAIVKNGLFNNESNLSTLKKGEKIIIQGNFSIYDNSFGCTIGINNASVIKR